VRKGLGGGTGSAVILLPQIIEGVNKFVDASDFSETGELTAAVEAASV
jgi:hypothetical protein